MGEHRSGAATADVRLVELSPSRDVALLEALYTDVLVPAFPPDELSGRWWSPEGRDDLTQSATRTVAAVAEDGRVLGGAVTDWFAEAGVLLLSYLAVTPGHRSAGLGRRLIAHLLSSWSSDEACALTVAEVEDPRHHETGDQQATRRLRFYERLGAEVIDAPYFQPRLSPERARIPHMLLVVLQVRPGLRAGPRDLAAVPLYRFLTDYITQCEGAAVPYSDPAVAWMLGHYAGDTVRVVPLTDLADVSDASPPAV